MKHSWKNVLCPLILLATPLAASPQSPNPDALQALVAEVRELRLAIERSTTLVPRMQMLISRLQLQQDRVDRQERELQIARNQILTEGVGKDRMLAALRQFEDQARTTTDPALRKQAEEAVNSTRAEVEQQALREQFARQSEAEAANKLKTEQAKLDDLAAQLDRLDKAIAKQ